MNIKKLQFNNTNILENLKSIKNLILITDESLSKHTSYKVGGNADYFCIVKNLEQLRKIFDVCYPKHNIFILGNGTNVLFSDEGYRGVVIKLSGELNRLKISGNLIKAGSPVSLSSIIKKALESELSGLEFAWGIPGTLGGSINGNSGAFGSEICDLIKNVKVCDYNGKIHNFSSNHLDYGHRYCKFPVNGVILEADLKFKQSSRKEIEKTMKKNMKWRRKYQPIESKTAGSVFKNPEGMSVAKLLESIYLKGKAINGARFSPKHINFIENFNNAKAKDIYDLVELAKELIYNKFKIVLETEIKLIGFN